MSQLSETYDFIDIHVSFLLLPLCSLCLRGEKYLSEITGN